MKILKADKFRLYPTEDQENNLAIQFGHARFVYNRFINERKTTFLTTGKSVSFYEYKRRVTAMKQEPEYDWLKQADSQVLQESLADAHHAYQNFFRAQKTPDKDGTLPKSDKQRKDGPQRVPAKGYPNFWSKHDVQSIRYPQRFKLDGNKIYLPKVGLVKIVRHRKIEGEMKNATVSKAKTGKYFVSIQCQIEIDIQPKPVNPDVGIDLGIKDFATLNSDSGTVKIEPPKYLHKAEKLLKIRQRRVSRKVKGSHSRNKARLILASTHEKVTNRRKDFHHQLSRQIVNNFGSIGIEKLNIKGMVKNHNLAKSIYDVGWSQFVNFLEYKATWVGVDIVRYERWFASSKTCSACGYVNKSLTLAQRSWTCPDCECIHDRDENAARNLRPTTLGAREINAVGAVDELTEPIVR